MIETWQQGTNQKIYPRHLGMKSSIKLSYSSLKCMFIPMHILPYLPYCITAPIASMHDHINACSWYQSKKQRENPNLAVKDKQTTKQRNRDLESIKRN